MYQDATTPLINAAEYGHLPVVEYLVERGADLEAKDGVSHVINNVKPHMYTRHILSVNISAWKHSITLCCNKMSFING